jgi:hypothetical protein
MLFHLVDCSFAEHSHMLFPATLEGQQGGDFSHLHFSEEEQEVPKVNDLLTVE